MKKIEVLFSPAEFAALPHRDLTRTTCIVFDILRATSSIITALANGAMGVLPVATIADALAKKAAAPEILLAGERDGFRITSHLTGTVDFEFGNSPREFESPQVRDRRIVMTTTNGTRALKACHGAREILAGSFLNLSRVAERAKEAEDLLLVCSGTYEEASFEDLLGAGAVADSIWKYFESGAVADSAQIARNAYLAAKSDLPGAMQYARNARRLLGIPALRDDVAFCLTIDKFPILATLSAATGEITRS